jgi:hypothetical protein
MANQQKDHPEQLPYNEKRESGVPGGGEGRVDNTGVMPEGVHVDPNLTEGQPGYQESGGSEIIPDQRLRG